MASSLKASALACGMLLSVGLPANSATSADWMNVDPSNERLGGQPGLEREAGQLKGAIVEPRETVQGQSYHIDDAHSFVKGQERKEVGLPIDETTQKTGNIRQR
jgi:hypothetical protein